MSARNSLNAMPMLIIDTAILNDVTFTKVTTGDGFPHPAVFMHIWNHGSSDIEISYDGITPHDVVPEQGQIFFPMQTSATPPNYVSALPKGTDIYLRVTNFPGVGNFYLAAYYQQQ